VLLKHIARTKREDQFLQKTFINAWREKKHFKMKSKIKIILRNIYIPLESSESTDEIKYAEHIFNGHELKM